MELDPPDYNDYFSISPEGTFTCSALEGDDTDDPPTTVVAVVLATNTDGEDKATVVFNLEGPNGRDPPEFNASIYDDKELDDGYATDTDCYAVLATSDTAVTYSLVDLSPDIYDDYFVIDPNTGTFTCMELLSSVSEKEKVTVVVRADNAAGADEATVLFTLLPGSEDEDPPQFDELIYDDKDLDDGYTTDSNCYTVTASSDTGVTYSKLDISPPDYDPYFDIDAGSGTFTCTELPTGLSATEKVTVVVQASNGGGDDETTVIFSLLVEGVVQENPPQFDELIYDDKELDDGYTTDSNCYTVTAASDTGVTYSKLDISPLDYSPYFDIDAGTGTFTCFELDAGLTATGRVTVVVQADNGEGTDEASVIFSLLPAPGEEDPPEFGQDLYDDKELEASYDTDTDCYTVTAASATTVTYSVLDISPTDYLPYFEIDSVSGTFTCTRLDSGLEDTDRVTVVVQAENGGGSDETTIVFTLLQDDDSGGTNDPVEFEEALYEIDLDDGYATDEDCLTVTATPESGTVTYSVLEISPAEYRAYFPV